jgi:hypothetical protein
MFLHLNGVPTQPGSITLRGSEVSLRLAPLSLKKVLTDTLSEGHHVELHRKIGDSSCRHLRRGHELEQRFSCLPNETQMALAIEVTGLFYSFK